MKCPKCDAGNPDLARFCLNCGEAIQTGGGHACPRCGGDIPGSAYYCPGCGRPVEGMGDSSSLGRGAALPADALQRLMPKQYLRQLLAHKGKVSGERRVVTTLFFDVVDSTGIAESLDPEDVVEVMNGAFEVLVKPIYRYKGTLARLMGDGVLSFFGAPIAHEDDPIRACRAALDIITSARGYADRLRRERGIERFDVRVGINTGLVVVGEVGADLRVEYTAMGDAVNLASRMESAAEPGTILITENTKRLLKDSFETEDAGLVQVKGKSEPVQAFRLTKALSTSLSDDDAARSPLVGRDAERKRVFEAVHNVQSGRGRTLAIAAESGLGKTRLVSEARGARSDAVFWGEGRCASYTANVSYWIAGEVLRGLLGVNLAADWSDVEGALRRSIGGADDLYPPLARVLDLPGDESHLRDPGGSGAADMRARIARAFAEHIDRLSRRKPVVLVWENLHWADDRSLEILESLVPLAANGSLLLLLTYRPDGGMRKWSERLSREHGDAFEILRLDPLDRNISIQLLHNLVDGSKIPEDVLNVILESAEGNAFFLEEILKSLLDAKLLEIDGGCVVATSDLTKLDIPTTVHGAIMSRVDRLFPREKRTLQTASVIGRAFPRHLLSRIAGDDIGHDQVGESIETLRKSDFLRLKSDDDVTSESAAGGAMVGETVYMFNNSMTAEVVYNSMLKSQRRELHERTGRVIEKLFHGREGEVAPLLAFHFERSDAAEKAFQYTVMSAQRAARVFANQEAIARFQRALELGAGLPEESVAEAHEGLGDVFYVTSNYAAAMEQYDSAIARVGQPENRVTLNRKMGQVCEKWGRYEDARKYFEKAMADLREPVDNAEAAHIYGGLGMAYYRDNMLDDAFKHLRMAEEMMRSAGNEAGLAQAHNNLGMACCKRGAWDEAASHLAKSIAIWQGLRDTYGLAASHNNLGLVLQRRGELKKAAHHHELSLGLFEQLGNLHGLARAYDNLSHVHMELGDQDRAMELMKKSVAILADISVDRNDILPEMWQSGEW